MLRAGCVLVSVWAVPNLLLAIGIFVALVVFGENAPALTILFDDVERAALPIANSNGAVDARLLSTVNALAVLANAIIAAFCALALFLTWRDVRRGVRSSMIAVSVALLFVQIAGFASDAKLGNANVVANALSAVVLALALVLCARGVSLVSSGR